jgi:DNA-binding MarR family transcriptional regulator
VKSYDEMPPVPREEYADPSENHMRRLLDTLGRIRSEKRRTLLEILNRQPGLNIDELAQSLGVRRTAAIHHLRRLEKQITIVRVRQGRHVLHFLGSLPPARRAAICLARVPSIRRIIDDLVQFPQYSQQAVAERIGVSRRTVRRAIRRLLQGRLIDLVPADDGRNVSVRLGGDIQAAQVPLRAPMSGPVPPGIDAARMPSGFPAGPSPLG